MKNFEDSFVKTWKEWDSFGRDFYFYDVELKESAFDKEVYKEIMDHVDGKEDKSLHVFITLEDTGAIIQVYTDSRWWEFPYSIQVGKLRDKGFADEDYLGE